MILGTDVSIWQNDQSTPQKVDFVKMKAAGASFVFIKASQTLNLDGDMLYNWKAAKDAGMIRGAYHFLTWDTKAESQADYFCSLLHDDPGELPPTCDFEWWSTVPSNASKILWAFLQRVEQNMNKVPMIYTAMGFWQPSGSSDAAWLKYPLWIANYGVTSPAVPKPWGPNGWTFWQYSANGDGPTYGVESSSIDLDYFNGAAADLAKLAGIQVAPAHVYTDQEKLDKLWEAHPELH